MAEKSTRPEEDPNVFGRNVIHQNLNVHVWDMDETLILLNSLLRETFAEAFNGLKDVHKGVEIGRTWEKFILQICDDYFFYEQIENYNKPFLDVVNQYDDGKDLSNYDFNEDGFGPSHDDTNNRKLAYRHRVIAQKYIQGLQNILDQETVKIWNELYDSTDEYTDKWLSSARAILKECSSESSDQVSSIASGVTSTGSTNAECQHVNVLVTYWIVDTQPCKMLALSS
ncbi:hypothetical protein L6164_019747 [Bauhinia variegata]|uniref:Uncharacterized protein n=1 Tax=Bauhinia variegata TaxID=167791 RepID=A0ACB9MUV2_BAUVA|nr:hypothetical protein L6164_019747 [Bauhinia variegata]